MKRLLLVAALSLLTAGSSMAQTVVLVRHAEKVDDSADPVLSEAGQARAQALAMVLADAHPGHVFTSPLQRTRLTAAPTAGFHSVTVEPISLEGGGAAHVAAVAARVRALPDDAVVLVVGHSNTIPQIAWALGYTAAPDMPECEYDRLTVLDLNGDSTRAVVGRYGAPTTC
jgi:broad specificity phosphatase PhoE